MARLARPNTRTALRYISPEDSAIGFEQGTEAFREAWNKYTDTFDERHLNLKIDEKPSYYYLKILSFDSQTKFYDALRAADEGDEKDENVGNMIERMFSPVMLSTTREFIETNLIGCDDHQEVVAIAPDGSFDVKSYSWKPGEPRPDGLVDAIVADQLLAFNMIMFCINTNKLSEKEKKR